MKPVKRESNKREYPGQIVVGREKLPPKDGPVTVKKIVLNQDMKPRVPVGKTLGTMLKDGHI